VALGKLLYLGLQVSDVDRPPFQYRSAVDHTADQWDDEPAKGPVGDRAVVSDEAESIVVQPEDRGVRRLAQPSRALGHGVEHRLDVGRRAADDAQDLARRRLLLQRLGEVAVGVRQLARARLHLPLEALVGFLEARRHAVERPREGLDLVAGVELDRLVEPPGADSLRSFLEHPDRRHHAPGEPQASQNGEAKAEHEDDGAPDDRGPEGGVGVGGRSFDEDEPAEGGDGRVRRQDLPAAEAVGDHGHRGIVRGAHALGPRRLHLDESGEIAPLP